MPSNLKTESDKCKKYNKEIIYLNEKLSKESALALGRQEENKNIKSSLAGVSKEKSDLVRKITTATGISNIIEEKLKKEINDLKNTFLEEMSILTN